MAESGIYGYRVECKAGEIQVAIKKLWEPTTIPANQCAPQQHQRPLGQDSLATANKNADL
jgi:hypothetical protein